MDVAIGVQYSPRELRLDVEIPSEQVRELVEKAFAEGRQLLWLTDKKGRQVAVPVDKLTYVEVEAQSEERRVGFSSGDKEHSS